MNRQTNLRWNLIVLLAVLGLARPLLSITGVYSSLGGSTWAPALVTIMIAAVWVGIAVATCSSSPLATLALAAALYGVLPIVLQQITWDLVLGGAPEGYSLLCSRAGNVVGKHPRDQYGLGRVSGSPGGRGLPPAAATWHRSSGGLHDCFA
jgi:hypothetical protein